MKKIYLGILFFFGFFIFSLNIFAFEVSANNTMIDIYDITLPYSSSEKFFGDNLYEGSFSGGTYYGYLNAYYDYMRYLHPDTILNDDLLNTPYLREKYLYQKNYQSAVNYMFDMKLTLYDKLLSLLPSGAVTNSYYTISYSGISYINGSYVNDSKVNIYLIFYPQPIVYTNHSDGLKGWTFESSSKKDTTFVYKFKITKSGNLSYVSYKALTYEEIFSNIDTVINYSSISNSYYLNPRFYNFFYMSNFTLLPKIDNASYVPLYSVVRVSSRLKDSNLCFSRDCYYKLSNDKDDYFGLYYFNLYAFSGGTLGIQPLYSVLNYEQVNSPPYNGGYSQFMLSVYQDTTYLESHISTKSTIYYSSSILVTYTENAKPSLNRDVNFYNCGVTNMSQLCSLTLDFSGLENPGVIISSNDYLWNKWYETIIFGANSFMSTVWLGYPVIWYRTRDFDSYIRSTQDVNDFVGSYNDETGEVKHVIINKNDLEDFYNSISINHNSNVSNISSISSIFKTAFDGAKDILNCGIEILSLCTSFFTMLSIEIKAFLIVIFTLGLIVIFVKTIM